MRLLFVGLLDFVTLQGDSAGSLCFEVLVQKGCGLVPEAHMRAEGRLCLAQATVHRMLRTADRLGAH